MTITTRSGQTITVTEPMPANIPEHGWQLLTNSTAGTPVAVNWSLVETVTPAP